jgi:hypothetical protein
MKLNIKNKTLLVSFILALIVCYVLAFSKTKTYYNQYKNQQNLLNNIENSPKLLTQLKTKELQIDKWLSQNNTPSSTFQNELLRTINTYALSYNLKIIDFQEPHEFIEKQTAITSYIFTIEGSFNNVLLLINKVENASKLGMIKHISTIKKNNFKTAQDYLLTTIIIQKGETN